MDMDSTVKPLYGHQEDAKLGYNPTKPGRPSHVYHTDFIANLRIVLEVEVQAGNQAATSYAQPGLWALLDGLDEKSRPVFWRGDCSWGTERAMEEAEERKIPYVFKLKPTAKVKRLIARLFQEDRWRDASQAWQGLAADQEAFAGKFIHNDLTSGFVCWAPGAEADRALAAHRSGFIGLY